MPEATEEKKVEEAAPEAAPVEKKEEAPAEPEAPKPEEKKESTIGEIVEIDKKPEEAKNMVPEAAFLDEKKGRKAAEKRIEELEKIIKDGGSRAEINADIDDIAKRHNVDAGFLRDFAQSVASSVKAESEKKISETLAPVAEREKQERIDRAFEKGLAAALEKAPEFKDIVNKDAIKALSLNPKNANKTFSQLLEEVYGNAIPGKRSIETKKPGVSKEPGEIDFDRAKKDGEYFAEIMADPTLKKKYNDRMMSTIGDHL